MAVDGPKGCTGDIGLKRGPRTREGAEAVEGAEGGKRVAEAIEET
jgi:hypothetical protein